MRLGAWSWIALATLVIGCGDDDACPEGLVAHGGRCVSPDDLPDAGGADDGGLDCGDEDPVQVWDDADGDGWGAEGTERLACAVGAGEASRGDDCDDGDAFIHPEAAERCNAEDDDCNEAPDDGLGCVAGTSGPCDTACGSTGEQTCSDACIPSACQPPEETCNHVDDDCDGIVDEDLQGWLGDPVVLSEAGIREGVPTLCWTGNALAVGWAQRDLETLRYSVTVRTHDLDGAPVGPPIEVAETEELASAADVACLGELALFLYAVETENDVRSEPVLAITPLSGDGGPVPVPLPAVGDTFSNFPFEVLAGPSAAIVSMLTPIDPPNELGIARIGLDPIEETNRLTFADRDFADVELATNGDIFVTWTENGSVTTGRYDARLEEIEAPRVVASGAGGYVVPVGDGALLVHGTVDNVMHALPLAADLTPGDVVEDVTDGVVFPEGVASSGTDVLAITMDFTAEVMRSVRLGPDGVVADAAIEIATVQERALPRVVWAGDRWAFVYLDISAFPEYDIAMQTYGCLP